MKKKLKKAIVETSAAVALTGVLMTGVVCSDRKDMKTIEKGVMEICGDENHVKKVQDYHHLQRTWNKESLSAKELVKRHEKICPGHGIDYKSASDDMVRNERVWELIHGKDKNSKNKDLTHIK